MRFDPSQGISAQQRIARASASDLETCFIDYADFTPEKAKELANNPPCKNQITNYHYS
jgi:16S rRNA C1402 N4-methylase RsmH